MKRVNLIVFTVFSIVCFNSALAQNPFIESSRTNESGLLNVYENLYSEIQRSEFQPQFIQTVIQRVCEHEYIHCPDEQIRESKSLEEFYKKIIETNNKSTTESMFTSKVVADLIEQEKTTYLWEQSLARQGYIAQMFSDGDGAVNKEKTIGYKKKNSPFDLTVVFDRLETLLFGNKHVSAITPKFLSFDTSKKITTDKNSDTYVHPENTSVPQTLQFKKTNGSITAQIQYINHKVFSDKLNQVPLKCIKNTKGMLKKTACDDDFPTPHTAPRMFNSPAYTQDVPESEKWSRPNNYQDFLSVLENEKSCVDSFQDTVSANRIQKISVCELKKQLTWSNKLQQDWRSEVLDILQKEAINRKNNWEFTKFFTNFFTGKEGDSIVEYLQDGTEILLKKPKR
ncbi:hypothetical protein CSB37_02910 [bacterium DOLZORAL124_38_8]|nr:MAG: hypothetical protein CSB37_02910 [bacterium DOLZORAL124_38_8]